MSAMSDFLEVEIRKHVFRTGSFTKPTVLAVALFTAAPSDAGGGTEVSGGSYARVPTRSTPIGRPRARPTASPTTPRTSCSRRRRRTGGVITHFGIFDATTAGNLLIHGALTTPKTVNNGDPAPKFVAGALDVTFA